MTDSLISTLTELGARFQVEGVFAEARPYGNGHINDTYLALYRSSTGTRRYVHQRINTHVFREPEKVMENIQRVTEHIRNLVATEGGDPAREVLTLIPARDGSFICRDALGHVWRTYAYIDRTQTFDVPPDLHTVYQTAYAFGRFQRQLASLPGPPLHETIPGFHHTPSRFDAFVRAVEADPLNRAARVKGEIAFLLRREADAPVLVDLLEQGRLPVRATHNDTKINNILFDELTGEGICVIDLDTVMPGSALYDFGDMVRAAAARSAEDDPDPSRAGFDLALFTQLARGYVHATRDFLTFTEFELLAFSARLITYEQALRFLTDYLNGDVYYKVAHPAQNLDRARTQIALLAEMEDQAGLMEAIVDRCRNEKE